MGLTDAAKDGLRTFMSTSNQSVPQFSGNKGLGNQAPAGTPGETMSFGSVQGGGIGPQNERARNRGNGSSMPPIPKGAIFGQ